jgi:spermidine/putrescine transport system permease protein
MSRRGGVVISSVSLSALAVLYLPMLGIAIFSVNASRYGVVWRGFTLDWYARLLHNEFILEAARNTAVLALVSTAIATVLGTLLALGMSAFPWPAGARRLLDLLLYLPVVTPDIVLAVALVAAFGVLRHVWSLFELGLPTMIIAHVSFQVAFVALVVGSRLAVIGRQLEEAARDLYASNWYILRRITLPLLMPGIVAGAMLALTLSVDDFVISFFTAGPDSVTLPIFIYSSVRRGVTPEIHALSVVVFLVTVVLVLTAQALARLRSKP